MEKVKVSKELFDALEGNKTFYKGSFKYQFAWDFIRGDVNYKPELLCERVGFGKVLDCLFYGYELEETAQEKLKRFYDSEDNNYYYKTGIKDALDILGEKVEGIND